METPTHGAGCRYLGDQTYQDRRICSECVAKADPASVFPSESCKPNRDGGTVRPESLSARNLADGDATTLAVRQTPECSDKELKRLRSSRLASADSFDRHLDV
jgi:hypothetical protein